MSSDKNKSSKPNRRRDGSRYEDIAERYYKSLGYETLERNYQAGHREIDLIVRNDTELIFVEVKGGGSAFMGHPSYRVDERKRRFLIEAAQEYLGGHDVDGLDLSFDVLTVTRDDSGEQIERYKNAFPAE